MEVLVCVKRVPAPGARIALTADQRAIDTTHLGFTISPHEECAVEEAVRLVERFGGHVTVLTVGPPQADEQLRDAIALGADEGVRVIADPEPADPEAIASALLEAIRTMRDEGRDFDLLLFGQESADAGNAQVGIRVAVGLDLPVVCGVQGLDLGGDGTVGLRRRTGEGEERYELVLPAVVAVKEGLNLPRYPALRGRMRARKASVRTLVVTAAVGGLEMLRLSIPPDRQADTRILGHGAEAAPAVVDVLERHGVI